MTRMSKYLAPSSRSELVSASSYRLARVGLDLENPFRLSSWCLTGTRTSVLIMVTAGSTATSFLVVGLVSCLGMTMIFS